MSLHASCIISYPVGKPPQKHNDSYSLGFKNLSSGQRMSGKENGNKVMMMMIIKFLDMIYRAGWPNGLRSCMQW